MSRLEFFFDYSCPYAYLASTQIEALAERCGATVTYKPFLLGGVFNSLGDAAPKAGGGVPSRAHANLLDMYRWAEHWGVPLEMPSTHPNRTVLALRATIQSGDIPRAAKALYRAYWVEGRDVSDEAVVRSALDGAGFDGARLVQAAGRQDAKEALRQRTDEAIERGVFGAPATFVDGELFWGQDRLDWVEEKLGGQPKRVGDDAAGDGPGVVEFWYDFSSPFAYLGATQIESVARDAGAKVVWRPFLLGALFRNIGTANVPLQTFAPQKQRHYGADLDRFSKRYGIDFHFPSGFPMRTVNALRVALAAGDQIAPVSHSIFDAFWQRDRDIDDLDVLRDCCKEAEVDPGLVDRVGEPEIKAELKSLTDRAAEIGLCGAPTCVVDGHLFWGQDRFGFVRKALHGWKPRADAKFPRGG